eukprot:4047470-Prorocentrum_lima.AAC.1
MRRCGGDVAVYNSQPILITRNGRQLRNGYLLGILHHSNPGILVNVDVWDTVRTGGWRITPAIAATPSATASRIRN